MSKIYVPYFDDNSCVNIVSSDVIRVYDEKPKQNFTVTYKDYFINSSYIYNNGVSSFSNYSNLPTCIETERLTSNIFYRNDLDSILIIFFIMSFFIVYLPYKLISRMFGRWLKL